MNWVRKLSEEKGIWIELKELEDWYNELLEGFNNELSKNPEYKKKLERLSEIRNELYHSKQIDVPIMPKKKRSKK